MRTIRSIWSTRRSQAGTPKSWRYGPWSLCRHGLELADKRQKVTTFFMRTVKNFLAWHGTGTEDYLGCRSCAFIAERVNFTKIVIIGFKHGRGNDYLGSYNGVAFWYRKV